MRINSFLAAWAATTLGIFSASSAHTQPEADILVTCNFRPQVEGCEALWRAGSISGPAVESVKAAYQSYGRYVRAPAASLTDEDRRYLVNAGIRLPENLTGENLSGLHHVINDPELAGDQNAKRLAVNGFLTRAVQAELYCVFNACGA